MPLRKQIPLVPELELQGSCPLFFKKPKLHYSQESKNQPLIPTVPFAHEHELEGDRLNKIE